MVQGVFVELAGPDDAFLDVFCSGQERVDQYFRNRAWFAEKRKGGSLTTYVFRVSGVDRLWGMPRQASGISPILMTRAPRKPKLW
jgi:hypothetical protein